MKEITGMELEVVSGEGGDEDDILIESLPEDTYDTGKEGYLLKADDGGIHISSNGYTGCLYGTKTLEQVYYTQDGTYSFPKGVTRDFSQYEVRGVMIDIARVPYRLDALKDIVKTFSFYKINEVHFHLIIVIRELRQDAKIIITGKIIKECSVWKAKRFRV